MGGRNGDKEKGQKNKKENTDRRDEKKAATGTNTDLKARIYYRKTQCSPKSPRTCACSC